MPATVTDIARVANVSVGTVSRVLRGEGSVSEVYAQRVREAADELQYRPLRKRRTAKGEPLKGRRVALVMLGMDRSLETLPVVAAAIHGAESALAEAGAQVLLADCPDLDRAPSWFEDERLDGVILKGALQGDVIGRSNSPLVRRLRQLPSVWILGRPNGCWGDAVSADDFMVGEMAAEQLVSRGHRRLAFINPKADHTTFMRREAAFETTARRLGATVERIVADQPERWKLPLQSAADVECLQGLVDRALEVSPEVTGVFCPADSIATLVYRALAMRGIKVGERLSVVSANNERPLIQSLYPSLTTIDTHSHLIGDRAVEQLAWRIAREDDPRPMTINLEPELVAGESVATITAR